MINQNARFTDAVSGIVLSKTAADSANGLSLTCIRMDITASGRWEGIRAAPVWPDNLDGNIVIGFNLVLPAEGLAKQPFYAELTAGSKVLDAYWLPEGEAFHNDGDSVVYRKINVALYIRGKDAAILPECTVCLYPGEPGTDYHGDIWIGGWTAENITPDAFPPELITEPSVPEKSFKRSPAEVSPIDSELIAVARDTLSLLKGAAESGYMLYGVQNFPYKKGGTQYKDAPLRSSDTYDLCGDDPAIFGVDSLSLIGMEDAFKMPGIKLVHREHSDPRNIPLFIEGCVRRSVKAWRNGSITTLSLHMSDPGMVYDQYAKDNRNPATGRALYNPDAEYPWNFNGYGYGNSTRTAIDKRDGRERSPHKTMLRMYRAISGGKAPADVGALEVYKAYIDLTAEFCLALQEKNIPVLYRPFHENSGDWFWWGNSGCENEDGSYNPDIFKQVWRFTVEYLLASGVHNCIYVYSPNGSDFDNEAKLGTREFRPYAITYPGDEWVDICAYDDYTLDEDAMRGDIETVTRFAAEHGKIAAASEVNGGAADPAVNEYIFRVLSDTAHLPCNLAYLLQWTPPHFTPYLVSPTRANSVAGNAYIKELSGDKILLASNIKNR